MEFEPIGVFCCVERYAYDAARQGSVAGENEGVVELAAGKNFEQALLGLEGFSHVWLLFQFHHNKFWKAMVQPPRHTAKVGVFASRAPYRPNGIGLSCVRLISVAGRSIKVGCHDLLDGTPILDIKPYIQYADSVPDALCGWVDDVDSEEYGVTFAAITQEQLTWLAGQQVDCLRPFLEQQLSYCPDASDRKRVRKLSGTGWEIAYRTWRAEFELDTDSRTVDVIQIYSGYNESDLNTPEDDPWKDKSVHIAFVNRFPGGR